MNPEHTSLPTSIDAPDPHTQSESPDAPGFLPPPPREAAALLHVTTSTVARWADAGKISSTTTLGGHRRYPRADIDAILHRLRDTPDDG